MTPEIDWNHPVHGLDFRAGVLAWQLRDISEVKTRRLFVRSDGGSVGMRITPKLYVALVCRLR